MEKRRIRLDELVVARGWAETRSRAKALIMAGKVRQGTRILDKAGREVPEDLEIKLEAPARFVSRGADKLAGYFAACPWPVAGRRFLDIGASTGGFSDFLLQAGAAEGTCVDVGHGQLHYKLRTDPRIHNLERVNARHLTPAMLPHPCYPLIVMDLSFISLKLILPVAWPLLEPGGRLIALIKPQFEAGKEEADRGRGVISDPLIRERILHEIRDFALARLPGCRLAGWCESPITGMSGNLEYLAGWERAQPGGT
jgi:23S rRNA (cytidine1920-2'-O)/16S rRNA (cytidine1409-2'-O)-methyltransferase